MKKLLAITLSLFAAICCRGQNAQRQNATYTPVETIITDLNADKINDTISLYELPVDGGPGRFKKINVSLNGRRMTFQAHDVWDAVSDGFTKAGSNAVNSKLAYIHKEEGQSFIFLFGFPYASGRDEIFILRIKDRGMEIVFQNDLEELRLVSDLNNDGHAELIAQDDPEIYKTTAKGDIGTYSPFLIYTLSPVFNLDKALTEKYNREHYVWAGIEYNADIEVLYPKDGSKPKLFKSN